MYNTILIAHSIVRWLVLLSLCYAIYRGWRGKTRKLPFTKTDDAVRHYTATIAHIQLMVGIVLYSQSPMVKIYFSLPLGYDQPFFFSTIHFVLMLAAIVLITIGSAKAKRKPADAEKFSTMLVWFGIALLIIFIAVPWPFSPLAQRPLIRY